MNYYLYSCELYHHGVKGQKWGVRKYQYKDGSLTSAGRTHYGVGPKSNSSPSSSSSSSSRKKSSTLTDEQRAKRKKIAKAVAITAAVAGVGVATYCVARRVNLGKKEAANLLSNVEMRQSLRDEAQYHLDKAKQYLQEDSTKNLNMKYGEETARSGMLRRDQYQIKEREWNMNLAEKHLATAKSQLEAGRADKRMSKYLSSVEKAKQKAQEKARKESDKGKLERAVNLLSEVQKYESYANGVYEHHRAPSAELARRGREQLTSILEDPSVGAKLRAYAYNSYSSDTKALVEDLLRKAS